jgi:hypothetical protein
MKYLTDRDQRFDRGPDHLCDFRVERAHNGEDLHSVVVVCSATPIFSGPPQQPVDGHLTRANGQLSGSFPYPRGL